MASKKQHAAIDFQGGATITIGGTSGSSQYLKTASNGLLQWASSTAAGTGMGDIGITNYEGLIHSSLSSASANFCLAQSSSGTTILNAKSGQKIYLRTEGGSSSTDQIVIDGGTVSLQGSVGSEGDILTCDANSKATWSSAATSKKVYEFEWNEASPPAGCSFVTSRVTNDTVRLSHTFGDNCLVSMVDVDNWLTNSAGYTMGHGLDISVMQGSDSVDIILELGTMSIPSNSKTFRVLLVG